MSGEYLQLEASAAVSEEYEPRLMWYDAQHQHFVILNGSVFSTWCVAAQPAGATSEKGLDAGAPPQQPLQPHPTFLCSDPLGLAQSLASVIRRAAVSVDFQLLALQINNSRVIIVDIANHKKWTIDIKSSDSSTIIRNGIIWSDHGGNSQDLIIVTNRGLEMYKISSVRSQCKLSRHLPHDVLHFWYEPTHRMLLLQVCGKLRMSIGGGEAPAYMTGYFFKTDKSDSFPKLELPPPDRIPKFQLDAELIRPENVSLVSIYGSLYCVFYHATSSGTPHTLALYLITKTQVTRAHVLPVDRSPQVLSLSVTDDLLVAHFADAAGSASAIFDIAGGPGLSRHSLLSTAATPTAESKSSDEIASSAAVLARDECYGHKWSFLSPDLAWDRWNGRVYAVRCSLRCLAESIRDAPAALAFLARRGRRASGAYCAEAKQLMIERLRELHSTRVGLSWLETAYNTIAEPYSNICKARSSAGGRVGSADLRRQLLGIFGSDTEPSAARSSPAKDRDGGRGQEPLEEPESFYTFLPHLATIAGQCLDRTSGATLLPFGAVLSATRRDDVGNAIISQSDLLSHIWLPLVSSSLDSSAADAEYCSWALSTCISTYRAAGAPVHPAMSILLLNMLARMRKYTDIVRLFQLQFFPDSSDLAVSALQLADTMEDEVLVRGTDSQSGRGQSDHEQLAYLEHRGVRAAVASLRQVSLDMLWRISEYETVIRWLLGHGHTLEALPLYRRSVPEWSRLGVKSGITAAEVFSSAVLALRFVGNEKDFDDFSCFVAAELAGRTDGDSTVSRDSLGGCKEQSSYGEPDVRRISVTLCPSGIERTVESERAEIMFTVQRFLAEWFKESLVRGGPAAIAATAAFPDELFDSIHAMKFRILFGFV